MEDVVSRGQSTMHVPITGRDHSSAKPRQARSPNEVISFLHSGEEPKWRFRMEEYCQLAKKPDPQKS